MSTPSARPAVPAASAFGAPVAGVLGAWLISAMLAALPDPGVVAPAAAAVVGTCALTLLAEITTGGRTRRTDAAAVGGGVAACTTMAVGLDAPTAVAVVACLPTAIVAATVLARELDARGAAAAVTLALAADAVAALVRTGHPAIEIVVVALRASALLAAVRSVTGGFRPAAPAPLRRRAVDRLLPALAVVALALAGIATAGPAGAAPALIAAVLIGAGAGWTAWAHARLDARARIVASGDLAAVFGAAPTGLVVVDDAGVILHTNPTAGRLLGAPERGRALASAFDGAPLDLAGLRDGDSTCDRVTSSTCGARRIVEISARPLRGDHLLVELRDVGQQRAERHLLERRARRAQALGELSARALHGVSEQDLRREAVELLGRQLPRTQCRIEDRTPPDGPRDDPSANGRWVFADVAVRTGRHARIVVERADGPLLGEGDAQFVRGVADVLALALERTRALDQARASVENDRLTDLPGRPRFTDLLDDTLAAAAQHGRPTTVLFLDLDGFKPVNDTYGHELGDELLAEVAKRLRRAIRPGDTAARLGGDEFAVLCPRLGAEDAPSIAQRLLATLHEPILGPDGFPLDVSASIGVAVAPPSIDDLRHVLREADAAMYRAKGSGKGRYELTVL
ncbi:MAG: diguanylate cyclase [Actinomycetota bacterium]|nr:diguanylate cyclase [Actinomycetota bacterium]